MAQKPTNQPPTVATRRIEPVVQESTPSMIAKRVREAIAYGHIAPGAQLGEAELARELGVSRGPLREGLQRLTAEGLLISIRNRGLFVIEMTPERVRDMYVARQAVERAAAEQIHLDDPVAGGTALMGVIELMAAAPDSHAVGDADIAFHELLVALAKSPRLSRMHQTLLTETRMCIHALEDSYAGGEDVRVGEHRAIAQSFLDRKSRLTDRLLVAHMKDAVHRLTPAGPPQTAAT
jgi:DNA-binding GntR family transcriptional regulator